MVEDFIAAIRIRGGKKIARKIKETLIMLNLRNQHNLIIIPAKPSYLGMLRIAKDYITWGEISSETKKEVETKKKLTHAYRLNPPRGGFERKGIKTAYQLGGALGYRGEDINNLIKRMI